MMNLSPTAAHIKRLIIADDDQDDQILLKEAIDDYAFPPEIEIVSDGCQLMNKLQAGRLPDLIFLDLNMPNKNGIECLMEIRSDKRLNPLPIIVMSTSKDKRDIESCHQNGANLFFSKPYTFDSLRYLVHSALLIDWKTWTSGLSKPEFFRIALEGMPLTRGVKN